MERKNNEEKTAKVLYITIIMALIIMAGAVGIVSVANKSKAPTLPQSTTALTQTQKATTTKELNVLEPKDVVATTEIVTTAEPPKATSATEAQKPTIAEPKQELPPDFMMPTSGSVSKEFSIDVLVYSNTMEDYRTHNGIDISAPVGSAVKAAADGIVSEVYEHPMMGYTVVISHKGDAKSVYHNLAEEISVCIGDNVKCGDTIGAVGESAIIEIAEEPHLHFEICIADERVNPLDYIKDYTEVISYIE